MLFQWWDLLGISCISDVLLTILPKVFSSHLIPQWLGVAKYHKSHRCAKNLWCWVQSLGENKLWLGRFLTCFNENFYKVFSQTYQFNIVCWQVLFLFFFCPRILLLEMLITSANFWHFTTLRDVGFICQNLWLGIKTAIYQERKYRIQRNLQESIFRDFPWCLQRYFPTVNPANDANKDNINSTNGVSVEDLQKVHHRLKKKYFDIN